MPRGRKKKTWQELQQSGCKPHRWKRRQAEELAALSPKPASTPSVDGTIDPEALAEYVTSWRRENDTFLARCVPGETICREYGADFELEGDPLYRQHGAKFNFREGHYLRICRDYAQSMLSGRGPDKPGEWSTELCTRFLNDLDTGSERGFYLDPVAADNVRMIATFGEKGAPTKLLRLLAMIEFFCWKTADGDYRFPDEELLNFHPDDVRIMDAAFTAQANYSQRS